MLGFRKISTCLLRKIISLYNKYNVLQRGSEKKRITLLPKTIAKGKKTEKWSKWFCLCDLVTLCVCVCVPERERDDEHGEFTSISRNGDGDSGSSCKYDSKQSSHVQREQQIHYGCVCQRPLHSHSSPSSPLLPPQVLLSLILHLPQFFNLLCSSIRCVTIFPLHVTLIFWSLADQGLLPLHSPYSADSSCLPCLGW